MPSSPSPKHLRRGVLLSSRLALPSLVFLSLLLLYILRRHGGDHKPLAPPPSEGDKAEQFRRIFLTPDAFLDGGAANDSISYHLKVLTMGPHLAGTPASSSVAGHVSKEFRRSGIRVQEREYRVLLSYPVRSSLSIVSAAGEVQNIDLSEASGADVVPPYHGYSPSGATLAPPVYANYGRREDYKKLAGMGLDVKGCIVVVRRGGGYRGTVVHRAAELGAAAVVIFSGGGGGGVERGTVLLGGPGDPLTPGWPAFNAENVERLRLDDDEVLRRFPAIPSLPVPERAAAAILRAMSGPPPPKDWLPHSNLDFTGVGGGGGHLLVNFSYQGERKMETIKNVVGVIRGEKEPDRYVILGNHRDAWTFGAVDPNSGTAALLEISRRLGYLLRRGWRPRRTILLCSWDAEEFGMIGSTEWVEENLALLQSKAVAYVNVDCAVQGPGFFASATPQLDRLLIDVTKKVKDPDSEGKTVYETWSEENGGVQIGRLDRADSDFTGFLHFAGVPSLDMYFGRDYPVYHTAFDCYEWMKKQGDPSFLRHVAMAEIWGLVALHLADEAIIPFDYVSYASRLQEHWSELPPSLRHAAPMQAVNASIHELLISAVQAREEERRLRREEEEGDAASALRRRAFNDGLMLVERAFIAPEGVSRGRPWFKHLIYSPVEEERSERGLPSFLPGIVDAISKVGEGEDEQAVQSEMWRVSRAISRAAASLRQLS